MVHRCLNVFENHSEWKHLKICILKEATLNSFSDLLQTDTFKYEWMPSFAFPITYTFCMQQAHL